MYPQDPVRDPCVFRAVCHAFGSLSGLLYISLICAGILLIEAALLYLLLRRHKSRWLALVPLALAVLAVVLAHHMWDLYWQVAPSPHVPPGWLDGGGVDHPYGAYALSLVVIAVLFGLYMLFIVFSKDSPRDPRTLYPGYPWK